MSNKELPTITIHSREYLKVGEPLRGLVENYPTDDTNAISSGTIRTSRVAQIDESGDRIVAVTVNGSHYLIKFAFPRN